MEYPSEVMIESAISDLTSHANNTDHAEKGHHCEACQFLEHLDKKIEKCNTPEEVQKNASVLDSFIAQTLNRGASIPILIMAGNLFFLTNLMRILFLIGVKVGRLQMMEETQTLDKLK